MDNIKWFHAIGICGKATSNVALMFKRMGWIVTGSDLQYFEPAKGLLQKEKIPSVKEYDYTHLTKEFWVDNLKIADLGYEIDDFQLQEMKKSLQNLPAKPDLCLIVESATDKNKEYLFAKKNNIDVRPFSQILGEYLVKPESIVVVGTAGKTTTTALLTFLLQQLGLDPSYMIGAEVIDIPDSLKNTNSKWSVLEGDEYHNKLLSRGAKFLEFKPKYLVITNVGWEHLDIFPTMEDYIAEFRKAVQIIPEDGLIIAKADDKNIDQIVTYAKCKVIRYKYQEQELEQRQEKGKDEDVISSGRAGEPVSRYEHSDNKYFIQQNPNSAFSILNSSGEVLTEGSTNLMGEYNLENILASYILTQEIPELKNLMYQNNFSQIVSNFHGAKKRLEKLYEGFNATIIDDFAVAPERVINSLKTLKQNYPNRNIVAIFEPNSGSRPKDFETLKKIYKDAFKDANLVLVPELSANLESASASDIVNVLKNSGIFAEEVNSTEIKDWILKISESQPGTVFVFMSAYRLTSIASEIVKSFS